MHFGTIVQAHGLCTCVLVKRVLVDLNALASLARSANLPRPEFPYPIDIIAAASEPYRSAVQDAAHSALERKEEMTRLGQKAGTVLFHELDSVQWFAPVPSPRKIICVGLNYRDHAEEQNLKPPEEPLLFAKFANTLRGHKQPVDLPVISENVDLEAELGFVIGKGGRDIPEQEAASHVLGYTIVNDVSARDLQKRDKQWLRAKSSDGFAPMGPYLVTPDSVPDPMSLKIWSHLNDFQMQSSSTSKLIFDVYQLIAFISRALTLEPGDIISTGTPAGVGVFRNPPMFLKDGDRMRVTVEHLGELENPVRRARGVQASGTP